MFDLINGNSAFKLIVSAIVFVLIDSFYLNYMKDYFSNQVKIIQGTSIKMDITSTILCYIFLVVGIHYFIIKPNRSVADAFLLGIIIYGVFETTNKALFSKWSWQTVFLDTLWGGILFALTTFFIKLFWSK